MALSNSKEFCLDRIMSKRLASNWLNQPAPDPEQPNEEDTVVDCVDAEVDYRKANEASVLR